MSNDYLLNISIFEAIGWQTIFRYLLILAMEIGVCVYLTWFYSEAIQRALRRRMVVVIFALLALGFFLQSPELYCVWFIATILVTSIFANTRLGFADYELASNSPIKVAPYLRNLLVGLSLVVLSYSVGMGSSMLASIFRGPQTEQKDVWYIHHEKDGGLSLVFKEDDWAFDIHVTKEYTSHFEEGDCLELTYYSPYDPFGNLENFATQVRRSDGCE